MTLGKLPEVDNVSLSVKSDENTTFIPKLLLGLNETQQDNTCNTGKVLGSMLSTEKEKKLKICPRNFERSYIPPNNGESLFTLQFLPIHMYIFLLYPLDIVFIYSLLKGLRCLNLKQYS